VQFVKRCHRFGVSFDDLKRIINEQRACRGNELESFVAAQQDPGDPMADYDLTWIWEELGVVDLRK
jgi:hypothetical protein